MIEIRRVTAEQWQHLRDIRLAALRDTPDAYNSTHEQEVLLDEDGWRARIARAAQFLAMDGDRAVGLAVGLDDPEDCAPGERLLVSVWVDPEYRGNHLVGRLIDAVADWARADGAHTLLLDVAVGNVPARRAYERLGFVATGHEAPMPRDASIIEVTMSLAL